MRSCLSLAIFVLSLNLAGTAFAIEPDAPERLFSPEEAILIALRQRLEKSTPGSAEETSPTASLSDRSALRAYYAANSTGPIWITRDKELTPRARTVIAEIRKADDWGLSAKDFTLPDLANTGNDDETSDISTDTLIEAELTISLAVLKYARYARGGRIPDPTTQLSSYLDRKPPLVQPGEFLDKLKSAPNPDAVLRDLHPPHSQFEKLRQALLAMRSRKSAPQEPKDVRVPSSGPLLKLGTRHADVALLRKRLEVRAPSTPTDSDADAGNPAEHFDADLETAVKTFQSDRDLSADGLVGRGTRRALNEGSGGAVTEDVLIANMEEWRWMPRDMGEIHIAVNIPEYQFRVFKNGKVVHTERAIIGKTNNQTPVFSDELETVVFHPFWGVPNSIKVKELWPSLARGGNILQRQNLRIQYNGRDINPNSVNWSTADIRKYHVYQPPGRSNVLGLVKFMFPNKHQVYMHDTPTKHLFKQTTRTYSHGCVRIRNPLRLAEVLLEADKSWDKAKIQSLVHDGPSNNNISLTNKIPVHMTYFTAVVDDDGRVKRFNDIYGHEKRIKLALAGKHHLIARGRDHLAPVKYSRAVGPKYQAIPIADIFQSIFGGF